MNVIIIMLDSLRPDHLGCHGNTWINTPNIDNFSRECLIFDRAYSEGLPTLPVRTALFTGKYTLMRRGWQRLEPSDKPIAEVLWDAEYDTALISDTYHMHKPSMAYERGFNYVKWIRGQESDPYIINENIKVDLSKWSAKNYLTDFDRIVFTQYLKNTHFWTSEEDHFVAQVVKEGIKWLKEQVDNARKDRLFLWLDSFDPHEPWDPPLEYYEKYAVDYDGLPIIHPSTGGKRGGFIENFTLDEVRHIRAQYTGEVSLVDKWIGIFFENLKNLGLWENSLIILLSDHGEPLGEHGIIRKVRPWPYEELSRIVLMIKPPKELGVKPRHVKAFVQTVDIAPTIMDMLEIKGERSRWTVNLESEGISLYPLIMKEDTEVRRQAISGHYGRSWSIHSEEYSLYIWPGQMTPYTFGTNYIKEQEKTEPELYKLNRSYIPPQPDRWEMGDQPKVRNIYEEEPEITKQLELNLRRVLTSIL